MFDNSHNLITVLNSQIIRPDFIRLNNHHLNNNNNTTTTTTSTSTTTTTTTTTTTVIKLKINLTCDVIKATNPTAVFKVFAAPQAVE